MVIRRRSIPATSGSSRNFFPIRIEECGTLWSFPRKESPPLRQARRVAGLIAWETVSYRSL